MKPERVFLTFRKFVEEFQKTGWITKDSLIYIYKNREKKGFSKAFKKIDKRLLIDVNEFWEIVSKKGDK